VQYETSQVKPQPKKQSTKAKESADPKPSIAKIDKGRRSDTDNPRHSEERPISEGHIRFTDQVKLDTPLYNTCEECGKRGHVKADCSRLRICPHCSRQGHREDRCRDQIEKLLKIREQSKSGDVLAEEIAQQLNE
jgi:hypothetical protein